MKSKETEYKEVFYGFILIVLTILITALWNNQFIQTITTAAAALFTEYFLQ